MPHLLVIGAGRSATVLIDYLAEQAGHHGCTLTVADASLALVREKVQKHPAVRALELDVTNGPQRRATLNPADVVISLLPPALHATVAVDCLELGKHLLTASYVSPEMRALDAEVRAKGLLFLNEMGLDPGIDHLSALPIIHRIQAQGGQITSFKSFCGGLVAPNSDDNPWGYKFTWNPRNVVLAGQGTATYLEDGQLQEVPYAELFTRTETIHVDGYGAFEAYPNRDSLGYRAAYGLSDVQTMLRGTLRRPGYCAAWHLLIQLGLTDDHTIVEGSEQVSWHEWIQTRLPGRGSLAQRLAEKTGLSENDPAIQKVVWLGLEADAPLGKPPITPAQALQQRLEARWAMRPEDHDLVVMQHQFGYTQNGKRCQLTSSLAVEGEDSVRTAMAKTVGLPLGIAAMLLLQGKIVQRGVVIPVYPDIYLPTLQELARLDIEFREVEE